MNRNEGNMTNERLVERESGEERRVGVGGVLVGGGGGLALQDGHLRVALDTDLRRRRLEPRLAVHLKCEPSVRLPSVKYSKSKARSLSNTLLLCSTTRTLLYYSTLLSTVLDFSYNQS